MQADKVMRHPVSVKRRGRVRLFMVFLFDRLTDFLFYHKKGNKKSRKRIPTFVIDY